ncbi:cysteine peptidase family C39 domain-containing protein [[Clostridium] polysaccharolyticum]|uniref:Butirosin biosynthesis protein H, N-terminal n=1 Tax=[Clostridium] polysaccharolyticum TaxID=29364 RepID=A0A1I0CRN7_9FIRM|nr:hypothetical protein [[Clostridium] polysaccharolyticum]SET22209.1 hypothetical protein SAMN04487772_11119 [[Clostridium] polysaccharolyticum]
MKKCLPVAYPPITSYPGIANPMSFLWVHKDKVLPWICDRYIQLIIRPNHYSAGDFYEHADTENFIRPNELCPFYGLIRNNQTTAHFEKLTDYIEYNINHEYYLEACLDNFYLSCSPYYYQKSHIRIHPTFIYGYDKEKKVIYISDFYENSKYTQTSVTYDEINKSIEGIDYFIWSYKYQNCNYELNLNLLKLYISDFLNSTDSFHKFEFSSPDYNRKALFGLDYYQYAHDVFLECENIDVRPFHILYDHKTIMQIRLEYLHSQKIISPNQYQDLMELTRQSLNNALILRNTILKHSFTKKPKLIPRLKERCLLQKDYDENLFARLFQILS